MKYFIDTEFIEGFHKPLFGKRRHFIDLISIGIVAEDGREYYAISNEYDFYKADAWVQTNVIYPMFHDTVHGDGRNHFNRHNFHKHYGKPNKQIASEIIRFVMPSKEDGLAVDFIDYQKKFSNPEFYGYYADYDWVLFCSLFGRMIDLPKGFPMYCIDLKQMLDEKAMKMTSVEATKLECPSCTHDMYDYLERTTNGSYKIEVLKKHHPKYPKQENEHNALADAKWNYELYKFLTA